MTIHNIGILIDSLSGASSFQTVTQKILTMLNTVIGNNLTISAICVCLTADDQKAIARSLSKR